MEPIQDVFTHAANDIFNDVQLQANPHVMHGLQGIIPGCRMNIEMTDAGGRKVSMSIVQARNTFKGRRRGPGRLRPRFHLSKNTRLLTLLSLVGGRWVCPLCRQGTSSSGRRRGAGRIQPRFCLLGTTHLLPLSSSATLEIALIVTTSVTLQWTCRKRLLHKCWVLQQLLQALQCWKGCRRGCWIDHGCGYYSANQKGCSQITQTACPSWCHIHIHCHSFPEGTVLAGKYICLLWSTTRRGLVRRVDIEP